MLKKLETISSQVQHANPYWQYCFDTYQRPDNSVGEYHYVHTPGSVMVIPRIGNNSFVLLRQYRYLNKRTSVEFPGGGVQISASIEQNARKELREEAGYTAESFFLLGEFNPCNGVTDELCSVFLADALQRGKAEPEASEEFEPVVLSARDIANCIRNGEIWDGMTISAWYLFLVSEHFTQH